jgi:hypothetical protein
MMIEVVRTEPNEARLKSLACVLQGKPSGDGGVTSANGVTSAHRARTKRMKLADRYIKRGRKLAEISDEELLGRARRSLEARPLLSCAELVLKADATLGSPETPETLASSGGTANLAEIQRGPVSVQSTEPLGSA